MIVSDEQKRVQSAPVIDRGIALKVMNHGLWNDWKNRQSCVREAKAKPLPGPLSQAFASGPIKVAGKTVNRAVPSHFAILQALESPLLKMMESAMTNKDVKMDFKPAEQWEICLVFTQDAETLYEMLENEGVKAIKKLARSAVGHSWDAGIVNLVMISVLEQIKRHIETTVRFAAELEGGGEVSFFQEPKAQ